MHVQTIEGVAFHFFSQVTDGEDAPPEVYYYWTRMDKLPGEVARSSFLPTATLEEAVQDAYDELSGANRCTEEDVQQALAGLRGDHQTKH